jgi:amidase
MTERTFKRDSRLPRPRTARGNRSSPDRSPAFSDFQTYNLTGWPSAVVRAGTSEEGLPIGVQVVARPWREDVALAVAKRIEEALGGWQAPPAYAA